MSNTRVMRFVAVYLAGAVTTGWLTWAFAADSQAPVNACMTKTTGALRVNLNGACKSTEVAMSWNQQGVAGRDGLATNFASQAAADVAAPGRWIMGADGFGGDPVSGKVNNYDASTFWGGGGYGYNIPANVQVVAADVVDTTGMSDMAYAPGTTCANASGLNDGAKFWTVLRPLNGTKDVPLFLSGANGGCLVIRKSSDHWAVRLAYLPQ